MKLQGWKAGQKWSLANVRFRPNTWNMGQSLLEDDSEIKPCKQKPCVPPEVPSNKRDGICIAYSCDRQVLQSSLIYIMAMTKDAGFSLQGLGPLCRDQENKL